MSHSFPWGYLSFYAGRQGADGRRLQAGEEHATFLDMTAAWGRYVRDSGTPLDWFKRDPIHASERGERET